MTFTNFGTTETPFYLSEDTLKKVRIAYVGKSTSVSFLHSGYVTCALPKISLDKMYDRTPAFNRIVVNGQLLALLHKDIKEEIVRIDYYNGKYVIKMKSLTINVFGDESPDFFNCMQKAFPDTFVSFNNGNTIMRKNTYDNVVYLTKSSYRTTDWNSFCFESTLEEFLQALGSDYVNVVGDSLYVNKKYVKNILYAVPAIVDPDVNTQVCFSNCKYAENTDEHTVDLSSKAINGEVLSHLKVIKHEDEVVGYVSDRQCNKYLTISTQPSRECNCECKCKCKCELSSYLKIRKEGGYTAQMNFVTLHEFLDVIGSDQFVEIVKDQIAVRKSAIDEINYVTSTGGNNILHMTIQGVRQSYSWPTSGESIDSVMKRLCPDFVEEPMVVEGSVMSAFANYLKFT